MKEQGKLESELKTHYYNQGFMNAIFIAEEMYQDAEEDGEFFEKLMQLEEDSINEPITNKELLELTIEGAIIPHDSEMANNKEK